MYLVDVISIVVFDYPSRTHLICEYMGVTAGGLEGGAKRSWNYCSPQRVQAAHVGRY